MFTYLSDLMDRSPQLLKRTVPELTTFITPIIKNNDLECFSYSTNTKNTSQKIHKINFEEPTPAQVTVRTRPRNKNISKATGQKRMLKGLRKLSQMVYKQVQKMRQASYKQVAQRLLREVYAMDGCSKQATNNEENIKRRVYDALNVLQAASAIIKHKKRVYCMNRQEMEKLKSKLKKKIDQKVRTINDLKIIYEGLEGKMDALSNWSQQQERPEGSFQLPLMLVQASSPWIRREEGRVWVGSEEEIGVIADADLVSLRFS